MPIQEGNIKLLSSQVMDDVTEGGGRATGTAIADGASNAIFPDVSELDRAYGRVNLRKTFVSVDTPNTDGYFGANVIIADPPGDPKVSCVLFTTNDGFDHRTDARNRLESYVVAGPRSNMRLLGDQLEGQKAIVVYQNEDIALPETGDVYCLSYEPAGTATAQQFVRVTKVEHAVQTFTDAVGDFKRRVVTLTISDALRQKYIGAEPSRFSVEESPTKVRRTSVADSARYFGVRPLTATAATGAFGAKVDTVYSPLVPGSTTETPVVGASIDNTSRVTIASSASISHTALAVGWNTGAKACTLRGMITPLSLTMSTGTVGTYWPKRDDGAGNIVLPDGTTVVGAVDYITGQITPDVANVAAWSAANAATIEYYPGANMSQLAFTFGKEVTLATRGSVYAETLTPLPAPGTVVVDFMALGKWYRLRDNGAGALRGDDLSIGAGSVNYTTGNLVVTLGSLPDVGSSVLFAWGSTVDARVRTASASAVESEFTMTNAASPGALEVTILKGGEEVTLLDNSAGVLSGGGVTGTVNYATGDVVIDGVRDTNSPIEISYSYGEAKTSNYTGLPRTPGGEFSVTLADVPIRARTVRVEWPVKVSAPNVVAGIEYTLDAVDDGDGNLVRNGATIGTVDYDTGVVSWTPDTVLTTAYSQYSWAGAGGRITYYGINYQELAGIAPADAAVAITYRTVGGDTTTTETVNPPITFRIAPVGETIVASSVQFTLAATAGIANYVERNGKVYRDASLSTGAGTEVGSVDYVAGTVSLTNWPAGVSSNQPTVLSCLTVIDGRTMIDGDFRTAGAPIRPGSFFVQATDLAGNLVTASADQSGVITGAKARGEVNALTGVVHVEFGELVTAAGNESEPWYNAALVSGGMIWKPLEVQPATFVYNSVVQTTLPLDASIVGLDPVRLPSDGRVPIIRTGDLVVVHHTDTTAAQTVSNGQTVDVERIRLSRVRVIGANDITITKGYTTDLDAGTVTFTDVAGYAQPVTVEHRVEDMVLVSDAQINGQLTFTRQLTHDFPAGSFASSALVIGDMRARVPTLFDQATWNNTFSDVLAGSSAPGTYNDVLAPIAVTNSGAITERWAIRFTNTTAFEVIGEHVGVIATGTTTVDCAPLNPASGTPYFTLAAVGWGLGWVAGNVLRFNTIGALFPVWVARTIQQGQPTVQDDSFTVLIRGDIDRP